MTTSGGLGLAGIFFRFCRKIIIGIVLPSAFLRDLADHDLHTGRARHVQASVPIHSTKILSLPTPTPRTSSDMFLQGSARSVKLRGGRHRLGVRRPRGLHPWTGFQTLTRFHLVTCRGHRTQSENLWEIQWRKHCLRTQVCPAVSSPGWS